MITSMCLFLLLPEFSRPLTVMSLDAKLNTHAENFFFFLLLANRLKNKKKQTKTEKQEIIAAYPMVKWDLAKRQVIQLTQLTQNCFQFL